MVLDGQRENVDPLLDSIARRMVNINPNALSWLSLIFAFLAGLFFYLSSPEKELENYLLYFAVLFVFLNGFFDAIDGKVAKLANKASKKGDFLDHALDRFADVLIVGGLALSPWLESHMYIGLLAIIGMLLTSYIGTQAQAIGYKRNYKGLLGRADRLVILMFIPIIQHIFLIYDDFKLIGDFYLIEWALIYFAVIGNLTAVQRFISTLRWFKKSNQ
jgi:archaetidylinositol phosphate synthase